MPRSPASHPPRPLLAPAGLLAVAVGVGLVLTSASGAGGASRPGRALLARVTEPGAGVGATHGAAPAVAVGIVAGASLLGRPTLLLLRLSVSRPAGAVAVTDLVPPGLTYVARSSALILTDGRHRPLADPSAVSSKTGTLLVWSSVRVPASSSVSLEVAPRAAQDGTPAAASALRVGSYWNDQATAYTARTGTSAPVLTAAGGPTPGATDLAATARHRSEVVAVAATQSGRLLQPAGPHAAQRLSEQLTISSTSRTLVSHVVVEVSVPGPATWAGCISPKACARPTVAQEALPVTAGQPDSPVPQAPAARTTTTSTTTAGTKAAAVTSPALFTVLRWSFASLPRDTNRVITYRLDAGPIVRARTEDVVTATAALPATATVPATAPVAAPAAVEPAVVEPAVAHPAVVHRGSVKPAAQVEVRARAVQPWPTSAAEAAFTPAGALPISSTASTSTTTTTTTTVSTRNPFVSTATKSTTTTTGTTTTGTATTTTTTTTTTRGHLATTGIDVVGTADVGVGLTAAGGLLLLSARGRRRRRPAHADPSAPAPDPDR